MGDCLKSLKKRFSPLEFCLYRATKINHNLKVSILSKQSVTMYIQPKQSKFLGKTDA